MTRRAILVCYGLCASIAVMCVVLSRATPGQRSVSEEISYSQLLDDVDQGKVRDVVIQGPEIYGTYADGRGFHTHAPNDLTLVQRLYNNHVTITARPLQGR
jgi:cell division protease FtsH